MSVPLLRDTPIWKLQAALKCGSCKKGRYASLVHMIKLTQEREIAPSVWVHPTMRREGHEEMAPAPGTPYAVQDGKLNATTYTRWLRYSRILPNIPRHRRSGQRDRSRPHTGREKSQQAPVQNDRQLRLKGNLGTGVMAAW